MATYKVKSITISRKPSRTEDGFKTAFIGLFNENNPHLRAQEPIDVLEIHDVEKIRINELKNISYYLMGNDIVINNLIKLNVDVKDNIVTLTGKQKMRE